MQDFLLPCQFSGRYSLLFLEAATNDSNSKFFWCCPGHDFGGSGHRIGIPFVSEFPMWGSGKKIAPNRGSLRNESIWKQTHVHRNNVKFGWMIYHCKFSYRGSTSGSNVYVFYGWVIKLSTPRHFIHLDHGLGGIYKNCMHVYVRMGPKKSSSKKSEGTNPGGHFIWRILVIIWGKKTQVFFFGSLTYSLTRIFKKSCTLSCQKCTWLLRELELKWS